MAIVEVSDAKTFLDWLSELDPKRFRLYITEERDIIVRKQVTTSGIDAPVMREAAYNVVDEAKKIWQEKGGKAWLVKRFYWDEDKDYKRQ